ncbi:MAG: methyltransferase domain-containing protein [Nitrospirota bacterium]|nr:methyltransferase domain-containing protein [Nitrospirota bacterium]
MNIILQCPVCRNPLLLSADGFQCSKNHSFDASREGYVNLLLAHKKHSREPGDSKEMIQSRRRFLDRGHYTGVSEGINDAAAAALSAPRAEPAVHILDAGCGEGFYLKRLKDSLASLPAPQAVAVLYGMDISKFAVQLAARRDRTVNWFVASVNELPIADSSLDLVLNVFSPVIVSEFDRVLKEQGTLVIASPGPTHLHSLRKLIYPEAREHKPSSAVEETGKILSLSAQTRITYSLELQDRETILDLLAMTPYVWTIDRAAKATVESLDRLQLDVDVEIRTFRKRATG